MFDALRRWLGREARTEPQAVAPRPDAETLLQPVTAALKAGEHAEAMRAAEALVWAHPDFAEGHRVLGELLQQRGEIDEARDSFTLALHYAPDSASAHYALGALELGARRVGEAIHELQQA